MRVRTDHWPKPVPSARFDWSAVDEDTYDGAPDSGNRNDVGYGATEAEAIADLLAILGDRRGEKVT